MAPEPLWRVVGHADCLERWIADESPSTDLRILVTAWLMTRMEDPYRGMDRMPEFPGWWFGKVARSDHGRYGAVYCTCQIDEVNREVYVRGITTLNKPV